MSDCNEKQKYLRMNSLSAVVKPGQVMPELLGQFILYSDEQP